MKIIAMGTGPFAVPTCQRILEAGHDIPLVVTRPLVNPAAKKLPPRPVYAWATDAGLPIFEPQSINTPEAITTLAEHQADLFFVCDYGQILSNDCLAAARLGGINLHGSILPRHRGAAPVQWALLRGDAEAGVTVIHMTPRLDAGPALVIARTPIDGNETAEALEPRLAVLGVDASLEAIAMLEAWDGESELGQIQDKSLVTRAPRLKKSDGQLDFRLPAEYLVRLVRACQPWPGTFAELSWPNGKKTRIIVRQACYGPPVSSSAEIGSARAVKPEEVGFESSNSKDEWIAVHTADGEFLITQLQPSGKRTMAPQEFLRGHALVEGCKFLLPDEPASMLE